MTESTYKPRTDILTLGEGFYDPVKPAEFPEHILRYRNTRATLEIGLDSMDAAAFERAFAAFDPLPENLKEPLALRYHGHQFGVYNRNIGDGRGFLYAQVEDRSGRLLDLGTKGSGRTPWSRSGDGRLTLQGGVREVLATSMLEALGVSTSRTLSLFETGEPLLRGDEPSPARSSVLVRLSHSHIRYGTFQRLAMERDEARMRVLVDYVIARYFPRISDRSAPNKSGSLQTLLDLTAGAAGSTCAQWMVAGFVHGVLNTDNMNITGESFDYGPYRFLPNHDRNFVAAYFDEVGLYAYARQPEAVVWNITRLHEALRLIEPALDLDSALASFDAAFEKELAGALLRRLGLVSLGTDDDNALVLAAFEFLESSKMRFDQFFFDAYGGGERARRLAVNYGKNAGLAPLLTRMDRHALLHPERAGCNYLARPKPVTMTNDETRLVFAHISERDDWSAFDAKLKDVEELRVLLAD